MPTHMVPRKYIPGLPGTQQKCLTSEHASLWDRFAEEIWAVKFFVALSRFIVWRRRVRRDAGAPPPVLSRNPDYLVLVNNCWGIEVPKDLPPLICPIGPVLSESFAPLTSDTALTEFFNSRKKVLYMAFGSHLDLPVWRMKRLIRGINAALQANHIDGVVWAMKVLKTDLNTDGDHEGEYTEFAVDYDGILNNRNPQWKVLHWAPQRAILDHPCTSLFTTHCGASSTMEAVYHGVPVIAMPVNGDQLANGKRLEQAGLGFNVDKNRFTAAELSEKIRLITEDVDGSFARNVLRMRRVAAVSSRRKYLAADLIEESIYDHELRFENSPHDGEWKKTVGQPFDGVGRELRPMRLQTAEARMSWVKANNVDMWLACLAVLCIPPVVGRLAYGWLS
jgi:hypothetical protein